MLSLLVEEFNALVDSDDAECELLAEQAPPELEPIEQYLPEFGTPER